MDKPTPAPSPTPASSFRQWLAGRTDEQLADILRHRPDTAVPLPPSLEALATRLLLRTSIARALAGCNAAILALIEDIADRGGEVAPVPVPELDDATWLPQLYSRALAFGDDAQVMLPGEVLPALPTGFSVRDQTAVDPEVLAALPAEQRSILDSLIDTGLGTTREAGPDADPARPIPQLIAAGLLNRVDARTVRLPRGVRQALRGIDFQPIPQAPSGRQGEPVADAAADEAGAAAGLEVVRLLGQLIDVLGQRPVELLKDKSVGVRHIAQLGKELDTDHVRELIALGQHARLLGRGEPRTGPEGNFLAPTEAAPDWLDASLRERWLVLLEAWETSPWAAWESGRGLDEATRHDLLPRHRARILDVYRHSAQPLSPDEFWEDLRFASPLFASHTRPETIDKLHAEAQWLGLIARGRLTIDRPVPEAVSYFLLQGDMTLLTPGPVTGEVWRFLRDIAQLESPGLASVYRLSADSIRRGLDAGLEAADIHNFLAEHAVGEVPQAVTVLIDDVARRHGTLRAGTAASYLRCPDEALLAQAVAAVARLRALAPTVAISQLGLPELLEELRAAGFAPGAEDATGATLQVRPAPALVPTPRARPTQHREPDIDRAVAALRSSTPAPTPTGPDLGLVQAAARSGRPIVVSYADKNGQPCEVTVTPLSAEGGQVDALGPGNRPVRFPLHRLTAVRLAE